jgi:endoglucanase
VESPVNAGLTIDGGYDAERIYWNLALDYEWFKSPQAYAYLMNNCTFFRQQYKTTGKLAIVYTHDGKISDPIEELSRYGSTGIGCFDVTDKNLADKLYQDKIIGVYSNVTDEFVNNIGYYDNNWGFFGLALYNNYLTQF